MRIAIPDASAAMIWLRGSAVLITFTAAIVTGYMNVVKWRRLFDATPPLSIDMARAVTSESLQAAVADLSANGVTFDGFGTIPASRLSTPAKAPAGATIAVYMQLHRSRSDCVKSGVSLVLGDPAIPLASITIPGASMPRPIDLWRRSIVVPFLLPREIKVGSYAGVLALTYNCPNGFMTVQSPNVAIDVIPPVAEPVKPIVAGRPKK